MSRPSVRSGFVLFGAVTLVVIGMATPAQAHAIVTSSQPEPGQRLGTAPGVVVLELSEPLNPRLSRATVTDPAGQRFTGGVSGAREIRVSLSTNAQGVYRVEWTTVSTLDGHAVRGSFQFGVGVSPGGAAETGGGATPTREDLFIAVARWVEALALLLAVGMLFLRRRVGRRVRLSRRPVELSLHRPAGLGPPAATGVRGPGSGRGIPRCPEPLAVGDGSPGRPGFLRPRSGRSPHLVGDHRGRGPSGGRRNVGRRNPRHGHPPATEWMEEPRGPRVPGAVLSRGSRRRRRDGGLWGDPGPAGARRPASPDRVPLRAGPPSEDRPGGFDGAALDCRLAARPAAP